MLGLRLGFFILAVSVSSGKPQGWGESGYEKKEKAVAVALGAGGTGLITNQMNKYSHLHFLLHLISKQCCPLA